MSNTTVISEQKLSGKNIFWFVFLSVIMCLTTIGNVLVCLAILKSRRLRTSSNLVIVNMAFGDIFFSLSTLPLAMVFLCYRLNWPLGKTGNIAFDAIWFAFTILSFINVAVVTIERYTIIARPFCYRMNVTKERIGFCCFCIWAYDALLIYALTFTFRKPGGENYLFLIPASVYYTMLIFHASLAFGLVPVLYVKIFGIARRHKLEISRQIKRESRLNLHFQMKATRTIGLVIILFYVVWLPFLIVQFVEFRSVSNGTWSSLCSHVTYITYCNGPINIFVYSYRNREIRRALRKALSFTKYFRVPSSSREIYLPNNQELIST